jgi:hypothetical protein
LSEARTKLFVTQPLTIYPVGWARTEITALAGTASSMAAVCFVLLLPAHGPALLGALLMICVAPGATVMSWVDSGDGIVQAGLTLVLSLAITGITGAAMIWLHAWHPHALLAYPFACILSGIIRLRNSLFDLQWERPTITRSFWFHLTLLCLGLSVWAYGVGQIHRQDIGSYGLLASANIWFLLGFVALLVGFLLELNRPEPRTWLLGVYLASVIVAIYVTVPIVYGVPEYAWVYKHIGVAQAFGKYGRVTDPSDIYEQWPVLFATVASVSGVAHISPISFAAWAPLSFELADVLLLLGIFRLLGATTRVAWLALFMYEGLIGWVGQDYLSPQAFAYLLWLGMVAILIRWLIAPPPTHVPEGRILRARARLLAGLPMPRASSRAERVLAVTLVALIYFAIVAAHQLTPYLALAGIGALVLLGLLRYGWLILLLMLVISLGYLAPRYSLIAQQYGGLFSSSTLFQNVSGQHGAFHGRSGTLDAIRAVTGTLYSIWLVAFGAVMFQARRLGRVAIPALLAFSPFTIILVQSYGGEAIYRVFLFSVPWCVLLTADLVAKLRPALGRIAVACVCIVTLATGLQGSYGQVALNAFTPSELAASLWLYDHSPHGSLLVLPADDFPDLESPDFYDYELAVIPADPQNSPANINEANLAEVQNWITYLGYHSAYVVFSRTMTAYYNYYGVPFGYPQMEREVRGRRGWSVVYHNIDTTIYHVNLAVSGR